MPDSAGDLGLQLTLNFNFYCEQVRVGLGASSGNILCSFSMLSSEIEI